MTTPATSPETLRTVEIERRTREHYVATNVRGGTLDFGSGDDENFTPVELLLVALGGCTGIDVDYIAGKRAEPETLTISVRADKVRDDDLGSRLINLGLELSVRFPDGPDGDQGRERLPRAVQQSHDRLCTVSRTIELATPVEMHLARDSARDSAADTAP